MDLPAPTFPSTVMVRGRPEGLVRISCREGRGSRRKGEGAGRLVTRGTRRLSRGRGDIMMVLSGAGSVR